MLGGTPTNEPADMGCHHAQCKNLLVYNCRGGGFCATAEEVHATRTKEEEMVRELLNGWQKGAHYGYIPEVKEGNIIQLECENLNSVVTFTQPNQRCANSLTYIKGIKRTGPAKWNTV